jgi:hypothetical protein
MIVAGTEPDAVWGDGEWIFVDVGFSNKSPTCGPAFGEEAPIALSFGDARKRLVERFQESQGVANFVIEAPLSVCFDSRGNPRARSIERSGKQTRCWYVGPGYAVMTAALYMVRGIYDARLRTDVRLFEGFVSFKLRGTKSNHKEDVCVLREIVRKSAPTVGRIVSADKLKISETDTLQSAFRVAGMDFGVPAVIMAG